MIDRVVVRVAKILEDKGLVREASEFEQISWRPVERRAFRSLASDWLVLGVGPPDAGRARKAVKDASYLPNCVSRAGSDGGSHSTEG